MKCLRYNIGSILILFLLSSCGGEDSKNTDATTRESAFDPMVETIDKAKSVEELSEDRIREIDKEVDKTQ
jgi:hypothetical protein